MGHIHFRLQLENEILKKYFRQNHKGNYGASFNTQKSTRWWIKLFSKSILLIYFRALLDKLIISYFRALWNVRHTDHTQEKRHDQIVSFMSILLHAKRKTSTSNSFWDIKIYKIMKSDWSRVFSITTQELGFSQLCGFYRFSKVVYHLKPKIHIDGPSLPSKYLLLIFSRSFRACLTKSKEYYVIIL